VHTSPTSQPPLTLIVAVYNAARYLALVLEGLKRQSMTPYEVVIADDGSGPEIRSLLEQVRPELPFPLIHLWHPDEGFRKNRMLNKAIQAARTDYLLFIDGDCVPHREFVADHSGHRQPDALLCGRRVNLGEKFTDALSAEEIRSGALERLSPALLWDGLLARSSNLEDALRIRSPRLRRLLAGKEGRILGCNFSVAKPLLERINGFNEDYRGPGQGEDSDIAFRLGLLGVRMASLRHLAVLYHLYHPATVVGEANNALYRQIVAARDPICRHGLRNLDLVHEAR